jgi:hypothetical protein
MRPPCESRAYGFGGVTLYKKRCSRRASPEQQPLVTKISGLAVRNWEAFDAIFECLKNPEEDKILLVHSGK